ncbi:MAG: metallophosphoesterase [Oscillospiraceae bacterium]|nr:metallophosphoesterase [Oscillospiraceae bacterium]
MNSEKNNKRQVRRIIKVTALAVVAAIVLVHVIHAMTLDRIVVYNEISFVSSVFPPEMDGYRIAFVTDVHALDRFDGRLKAIVDELNKRQVDMLILGGDIAHGGADLASAMRLISQIVTTDGIYGVEGNHDQYEELFAAMRAFNMVALSNSGVCVRAGFYLAGVEDMWNRNPNISESIMGAGADSFVLLVSHNPDVTMMQDTMQIDLILSGHTHGGQLNFFGRWSIGLDSRVISHYGTRFRSGWSESRDGTPAYVSRGVGEYYPRVFARPEVTLITLRFYK